MAYLNISDSLLFIRGVLGFESEEIMNLKCVATVEGKPKLLSNEYTNNVPVLKKWLKTFNGRGNLYIGRNPRDEKDAVLRIANVGVDIDAIGGNIVATREAAYSILRAFDNGSIVCSGSGHWVFWKTSSFIPPTKEFEQKFKLFLQTIRDKLHGVKIDPVFDNVRLTKLIGTTAFKNGIASSTRIVKLCPFHKDSIFKHINSLTPDKPSELPVSIVSRYPSRSEADFALAAHYQQAGLSKEDCLRALKQHALGRNDRGDDHLRIIEKVYNRQEQQERISLLSPKKQEDVSKYHELEKEDDSRNIQTGFAFFDNLTKGIRIGDIYTIAGRPGIGKTNYALNITSHLCEAGKTVLYVSTEMPYNLLWERMLKRHEMSEFTDFNFFVLDNFRPSILGIKKAINLLHPDILIFDHIQHVSSDFKTISDFVRGLKETALEQRLAVIIVSQLKRPLRYVANHEAIGVKPTYDDLKGTGTLEEESSVVLLMYREDSDLEDGRVIFDLNKNRYGLRASTTYVLNKTTLSFEE